MPGDTKGVVGSEWDIITVLTYFFQKYGENRRSHKNTTCPQKSPFFQNISKLLGNRRKGMGDQMEAPGTLHPLVYTPGTPPHTQPEVWPIFMFWAHKGLHGPQGTGPFWGAKIDFSKISQNCWGIEGKGSRGACEGMEGPRGFHLVPHAFPSIPQQF